MSDVIYIRNRAQKYNMLNGFSKADGMGGRFIKQGILIYFQAISDANPTGVYNASKAAKEYVNAEIVSGNLLRENQKAEEEKTLIDIMNFIEGHNHFTKPDGFGQNLIWREPTSEERAEKIEEEAEGLIRRAKAIRDAKTVEEKEGKLEEFKDKLAPKAKKTLSKPVGVVVGGTSAAGGGRG